MKSYLIIIGMLLALTVLASCNNPSSIANEDTTNDSEGKQPEVTTEADDITEAEETEEDSGFESIDEYANAENVVSVEEYNTKSSDDFDGYDVVFKNGEEEIKVLFTVPRNYRNVSYPTVLYFPGIASSHSYSAAMFDDCVCVTFEQRASRDVGDSEMFDVGFIMNLLLESEFVDRDHIYTSGSSLGSVIALRTANDYKENIDGVVVADVISDFTLAHSQNPAVCEYYCGGTPDMVPEEYAKRSAVNFASEIKCPVLLLKHIDVPAMNTTQADVLKAAIDDVDGECTIIEISGMSSDFVSKDAQKAFADFVEENN